MVARVPGHVVVVLIRSTIPHRDTEGNVCNPVVDGLIMLYVDSAAVPDPNIVVVGHVQVVRGAIRYVRQVDAIVHVVRCFDDSNIIHVDGQTNPLRDIDTINTEYMFFIT